ncbi:MAG: phenylacetate--CoA ligase family protein, partial [Eubacteriales bacterium]|nr:phenylacetate--CoA ligase family protein [Eubacteriales bacterium]
MDIIAKFIRRIVFPLMEQRKGNNIRLYLNGLKSSQTLPPEELKKLQSDKLKKLLIHCIDNVPAYKPQSDLRDRILEDPMAALMEFSVLTKERFKENPKMFLSNKAEAQNLIPNQTGGSTGVPVKFYIDRRTVEYYEAARYRGLSWNGIDVGDRSVMIWGNPLELNRQKDFIYRVKERFLKNRIVIPAFSLNPESLGRYVMRIRRYKPKYIYGYLSSLYAFASLMLKENIRIGIKLTAVVTTSETLHDFQRQVIEKAFECTLSNEYGARDGGIIAYTCNHGRMHISAENMIFETVDVITQNPI